MAFDQKDLMGVISLKPSLRPCKMKIFTAAPKKVRLQCSVLGERRRPQNMNLFTAISLIK